MIFIRGLLARIGGGGRHWTPLPPFHDTVGDFGGDRNWYAMLECTCASFMRGVAFCFVGALAGNALAWTES